MRCWTEKNESEVVKNLGIGKLYENKVGLYLFNVFFFFLFFIFHGILLASKFLVCLHFPADGCENRARLRKK